MSSGKYLLIDTSRDSGVDSIKVACSNYKDFIKKSMGYILNGYRKYTDDIKAIYIDEKNKVHLLETNEKGVLEYDDE